MKRKAKKAAKNDRSGEALKIFQNALFNLLKNYTGVVVTIDKRTPGKSAKVRTKAVVYRIDTDICVDLAEKWSGDECAKNEVTGETRRVEELEDGSIIHLT